MSRRSPLAFLVLSTTLLTLFIPSAASGQISAQMWNIDQGTSEREWSYKRKPPVELITFSWIPKLDPLTTLYFAQARCDIDNRKARNKVLFRNVQLTGVASDNTVKAAKASKSIREGEGKAAIWDLTPFIGELLTDDTVLVSGEFKAKKQLRASQAITCFLSVWELFDTDNLRLTTESERLSYFQEFVETRAQGLAPVPKTGQTTCYDAAGTVVRCGTGVGLAQDGDIQLGVSWPNPRFAKNGDGTVTDNLTGLIWLENANCAAGGMNWVPALDFANSLFDGSTAHSGGDCGLSDGSAVGAWRMPNVRELLSLVHFGLGTTPAVPNTAGTGKGVAGDPFSGLEEADYYWSSTTLADENFEDTAYVVSMDDGFVTHLHKAEERTRLWPVRGGQ